jgi:uncharacterized repeat protein (TIGR01451 family)
MKIRRASRVIGIVASLCIPWRASATEFANPKSYAVGTNPAAVAVADFNGDGKLDIAVLNSGSNNVSILLGNGDGTFQAAKNYDVGNSLSSIAVGDFNGDGKPDLAVFLPGNATNSIPGEVRVLLGNGDGTFQAPVVTTLTVAATTLHAGDFNGDKKTDLVISSVDPNSQAITLEILLGKGDGTFQAAKQIPASGLNDAAFAIADFNVDGKLDLAIAVSDGVQILLGQGNGTFQPGETAAVSDGFSVDAIFTADLNGDGKIDLIVGSSMFHNGPITTTSKDVGIFLGHGDGTFGSQNIFFTGGSSRDEFGLGGSNSISRPWTGDFNGDGRPDILDFHVITTMPPIPSRESAVLELHLSKGDGTFAPVITLPGLRDPSVVQDLNGDKLSDLITLDSPNNAILVSLNSSPTSGADLGIIAATASPLPAGMGINLTYSAHVLNEGPQNATGVTFTDTLPGNVTFVSATSSQGSCSQAKLVVTCSAAGLADTDDMQVTIIVTPTTTGTITNTMNVAATEPDLALANNSAIQSSTVLPTFTLTVTKTGQGTGTVTTQTAGSVGGINCGSICSASFLSGASVEVNAIGDTGDFFASWSGSCSGNGSCTITMDGNKSVTANFVVGRTLTVTLAGTGSGAVEDQGAHLFVCTATNNDCSVLLFPGSSIALQAIPSGTSTFGGWSGGCTGTDPNTCTITMNSNSAVTATFNPPPDFSLSATSGTLMVAAGGQVTDVISISEQGGFSSALQLSCSVVGTAPLPSCSLSPNSIPPGANAPSSKLTFSAGALAASLPAPYIRTGSSLASVLSLGMLGFVLVPKFDKRHRKRWALCLMILLVAILPVACGGGSTTTPHDKIYVVTVTATSGALQHTTAITVTVR